MQVDELVKIYQAKSDEELVQLAAAPEELTSEAWLTLKSELFRRDISIAEDSGEFQPDGDLADPKNTGRRVQGGDQESLGAFIAEVLRIYHSHFWLFFKITAPAVTIGTMAILAGRTVGREIASQFHGFELLSHRTEIVEIGIANFSSYLISWLAFSFAFGATCIAVEEIAAGSTPSTWRSLVNMRDRLGPFLRLCLLLFVLLLVAEAASIMLVTGGFWALHQWQVRPSRLVTAGLSYGAGALALLVLSRFALAVPALILDDCRVGQAMFRSDELTQGKWLTLAVLLAKSVIGGYIAALWPFWLASLVSDTMPLPSWSPWILTITSIIGVTVVEPTMFAGFALLYLKTSALDSAPSKLPASQLA
jgi:hypothetical protein